MTKEAEALRAQILELVRHYHAAAFPESAFKPGESPVPYAGRVFDSDELVRLTEASLDLAVGIRMALEFLPCPLRPFAPFQP
jgi:CDP-6-deoxy-D-xylo-4-hexulose-3-dehydrase